MAAKKDNSTLALKVALRQEALKQVSGAPFVLDAFGGYGVLGTRLYDGCRGVILERDRQKVDVLARLRPAWSVLEGNCELMLAGGLAKEYPITFADFDAYGSPWNALLPFIRSVTGDVVIVVTDGLRAKVKVCDGFGVDVLKSALRYFGDKLYNRYLDVCRWMLENEGARVTAMRGCYAGALKQMTLYWAKLSMPA